MRILGIDPGLERVGYGIVDQRGSQLSVVHYDLIKTEPGDVGLRLAHIYKSMEAILATYQPEVAYCERLFFTKNQTTGIDVAKALGVIQLAITEAGLPCTEISPPQVKLGVTGNGAADKKQVQYMVTKLLGLKDTPKPDDVADALAVAIAGALRGRH